MIRIRIKGEVGTVKLVCPSVIFLLIVLRRCFFCGFILVICVCLCHPVKSVFTAIVLGQVWYLIVSIPDLCHVPYFNDINYWVTGSFKHDNQQNSIALVKK